MNQAQATGNGSATDGDGPDVEQKSPTPTAYPGRTPDHFARHFPQTLVAMEPPTLPAAGLTPPPPEFRQFPTPQRSVPGHPKLRDRIRQVLLFWRRGA